MSKKLFLFILFFYSNLTIFSQAADIFEAIATEDEAIIKKTINKNNVNKIVDDNTPLLASMATGKPGLVKIILDAKANPNLKLKETGKTPLMVWMESTYMISEKDKDGNDIYKDDPDRMEILKMLLKSGAKVTEKDNDGKPVLTYFLEASNISGSENILKILLENKADPNQQFRGDNKKTTCQVVAEDSSGYMKTAFLVFLKQKKCDPTQQFAGAGKNYKTLLHFAVSSNDIEIIKAVLEAGANPNKPSWNGIFEELPIFEAITNYESLEILLKYKANPNSIQNETHILEHAARSVSDDENGERIISLLLSSGSDINHSKLFDSYLSTNKAVYAAQIISHERIEKFLRKMGAKDSNQLKGKKKDVQKY